MFLSPSIYYTVLIGIILAAAASAQQLSGSASASPTGGHDVNLALSKTVGTEKQNVGGGLFASGNTRQGPVTTGGFLNANKNGHGAGLQLSKTPGFGTTFQQNAHVNLLQKNDHNLNANAFHSRTHMDNGFKFSSVGGGLDYNHANGHGASATFSRIPQLNMNTLDVAGKANLWRSPNRMTTLDLNGGISKNFGGPFSGQTNKHIGLGLNHRFR